MISQQDLPAYIESNFPELPANKKGPSASAYDIIRQMLKYTTTQLSRHNFKAAGHCLTVVEELYKQGNTAIKNAIENVYVFSFSHAFFYDDVKRKAIVDILPASLYELYKRQVVNSHL